MKSQICHTRYKLILHCISVQFFSLIAPVSQCTCAADLQNNGSSSALAWPGWCSLSLVISRCPRRNNKTLRGTKNIRTRNQNKGTATKNLRCRVMLCLFLNMVPSGSAKEVNIPAHKRATDVFPHEVYAATV
ncbi:hypothetical protein POM88_052394 [Heracleum sosnowskyi]|uniref:Secreted protein n=1 Tax=Heracleum sosnowskyi TaxID=360622 RepID=A0AAD8GRL4_9APIA|nr:hypothetical protein POM88_052394 [Heracleum sosnowskyi]